MMTDTKPDLPLALVSTDITRLPSSTSRLMEARPRLLGISGGAMAILNKTPLPRGRPIIHGRETKTARAQRREVREILRALKKRLPDNHAETTEAALLPPIRI